MHQPAPRERTFFGMPIGLAYLHVVEGETGVIVIDPLTCTETSSFAFALYQEHRGVRPVTAMVYTHSHIDHFGGVKGIISEAEAAEKRRQGC